MLKAKYLSSLARGSIGRNIFSQPRRFFSQIAEKAEAIASEDGPARLVVDNLPIGGDYEHLISFSPESLAKVPWIFKFSEGWIQAAKEMVMPYLIDYNVSLYWLIPVVCVVLRLSFLPMMLIHTRFSSKYLPKFYMAGELGKIIRRTDLPMRQKIMLSLQTLIKSSFALKLKLHRLIFFSVAHIPLFIAVMFVLRKIICDPFYTSSGFFWARSIVTPDPYFVFPVLAISAFYISFGKGINDLNKDTIVGKVRHFLQICMICWLPILSGWPIGISYYIFCNSLISLAISSLMSSQWFQIRYNQEIVLVSQLVTPSIYNNPSAQKLHEALIVHRQNNSITEKQVEYKMKTIIKQSKV